MAVEVDLLSLSFKAENSFATKQFYCVELSAADRVDVCDAATDRAIGIVQNKPLANEAATVRLLGVSKAVSDGSGTAIAVGDFVGSDANGKIVKKETADYAMLGIALGASTANGTIISVWLTGPQWFRTALG